MSTVPAPDAIRRAPKVLLHDHLDGGLRPSTVVELAGQTGYSGSLERYLETFTHTVGVMQTTEALSRVAAECAEDLADDGVVYAEVRFAPELHLEGGLTLDEVVDAVQTGFQSG